MGLLPSPAERREGAQGLPLPEGILPILSHSLVELVREATKLEPMFRIIEKPARRLDTFYIPTRYPNGLAGDLSPSEFYCREDAEQCLSFAESILKIVRGYVESS